MLGVNIEFKKLIPPLSKEEYEQLEKNIIEEGCRDPLVVWNGTIIDGHNRYEICTKHGISYNTVNKGFDSEAHVRVWMRNNQIGRRNLNDAWRFQLQYQNKEDLAKIGAAKMVESGKEGGRGNKKGLLESNKPFTEPKHSTRKEIAKAADISESKAAMFEQVMKKSPEIWQQVLNDELKGTAAYKEIKKEEKKAEHKANIEAQKAAIESGELKLPEGVFEVIAIDPPWNYGREYDPDGSRVANPYPEMTQDQLLAIDLPASNDSVLFLWTTHQFIWNAKELMDKWGFTYKATLVWDKEKIGMGAWVRMQCEFCLVGIKGKPHWENTTWRDVIRESRREHSRKPDAFYEMVESITLGRRLEYFSREKRNGWEVFGNDVEKF